MFIPPLNMGQFQPSPATMSQWIYQIWKFLQENPIATETEIREFIQSELKQSETLGNAIEEYLTENPPSAPVQSVLGMTGSVQFDSRQVDLNSADGDTTIYEAFSAIGNMTGLSPIGSVGVNSGVIELTDQFTKYDFIIVRCGLNVSAGVPGGTSFWFYPVSSLETNSAYQLLQFDGATSKLYVFSFRFPTATTFEVSACRNITDGVSAPDFLNIRRVYGLKLRP